MIERYPVSAVVRADGMVGEANGASGLRMLTEHPELAAWARGFLATSSRQVHFWWRGATSWCSVLVERSDREPVAEALVTIAPDELPFGLTARELDVLTLLVGGLTNQEIAARLVTSVRTVSTHVEHILVKTGRSNRAAAAAVAAEHGIVRLPIPGCGAALASLTVGLLERGPAAERPAAKSVERRLRPTKRPFMIGSAYPLAGPAAGDGLEMRNGSALAVSEINARGGVASRPIRQLVVDADAFDPEGVRGAFAELIEAEVDAITIGYLFAEDVARELAASYGAPYLHAMTSEAQVERVRESPETYGRVFQVCPSEVHYGAGFLRFLDEIVAAGLWRPPSRRIVFVETPLPSGQMANAQTIDRASSSGWVIDRCELIPAIGADWDRVLALLDQLDPAAVMVTQFLPGELAELQRRFALRPSSTLLYAVYTPSIPQFVDTVGSAAEGLLWSTVNGTYSDPIAARFNGRYAEAYGRPPGRSHAGIAYDVVHLLARAWSNVTNPRDFDAVAEQLRLSTHRGVNGSYFLDNEGQCGLSYPDVTLDPSLGQAHLVFQIQDGRHRILSPRPYAECSFRPPPWTVQPVA